MQYRLLTILATLAAVQANGGACPAGYETVYDTVVVTVTSTGSSPSSPPPSTMATVYATKASSSSSVVPAAYSPPPAVNNPPVVVGQPAAQVTPPPVVVTSTPPPPVQQPTSSAAAAVVPSSQPATSSGGTLTEQMILAVMPQAASCNGAPFPSECATASQAVGPLQDSFSKYGITSKGAQAAIVALIAYESGELKYNHNHYPGRPGQGTRNMQMPPINAQYAAAVLGGSAANQDENTILTQLTANSDDDFGSAAWFLSTKCPSVLSQFVTDPAGAWSAYLGSGCISTSDNAQRDAYWATAKTAFGV